MSPMIIANIVFAAMSAALGVFAALILLSNAKVYENRSLGLVIFLLCSAALGIDALFAESGIYRAVPHIIGILWPLKLLLGPAIYAYAQAMTSPSSPAYSFKKIFAFTWPALVAIAIATPFYILPAETKVAIYLEEANVLNGAAQTTADYLRMAYIILFLVVTLGYLTATGRVLVRHMRSVRDFFSNIEDKTLNWLRWLLLFMVAAWAWGAIKSIWVSWDEAGIICAVSQFVELAWVGCFGYFGLRQSEIFQQPEGEHDPGTDALDENESRSSKYARSALSDEDQTRIAGRLSRVMEEQKLYRDPNLSLRQLSDAISVAENYISQTLNHCLGKNFFDYVNAYRIEEAAQRIRETDMTILAITYEVGFNSRSTFNLAFRKHQGTTPSAYRDAVKAASASTPEQADHS